MEIKIANILSTQCPDDSQSQSEIVWWWQAGMICCVSVVQRGWISLLLNELLWLIRPLWRSCEGKSNTVLILDNTPLQDSCQSPVPRLLNNRAGIPDYLNESVRVSGPQAAAPAENSIQDDADYTTDSKNIRSIVRQMLKNLSHFISGLFIYSVHIFEPVQFVIQVHP